MRATPPVYLDRLVSEPPHLEGAGRVNLFAVTFAHHESILIYPYLASILGLVLFVDDHVDVLLSSEGPEGVATPQAQRSLRTVGDQTWERVVVPTPWIAPGDDLTGLLSQHLGALLRPGDLVIISEKAATIASGRGVPRESVRVGRFASLLTRWVRPRGDSRGLSVPEKMQYVVEAVGRPRIILAVLAAAVTRPLHVHGAFYVVAGRRARCMDGGRPPFEHLLLPPLEPKVAHDLALSLGARIGHPVAIVDINDRGGSVRAIAGGTVGARLLRRILEDNPLGQRNARTPIGVVRRADVSDPDGWGRAAGR